MKLQRAVWAAFPVLGFAWFAPAQDTVKLEYKLQPATELTYRLSGTMKMSASGQFEMQVQGTISGGERYVVADGAAATGAMLIGQLQTVRIAGKMKTQQGEQNQDQTSNEVSVGRMDRAGNPVVRKMKDEGKPPGFLFQLMVRKFDSVDLATTPLPPAAVAVGATWEGITGAPLQGIPEFPAQAKVVSTLAEIKTVDGRRCAVIKSKFSPSDKTAGAGMPEFAITGDSETLFDIESGFSRSVNGKLDFKFGPSGGSAGTGTIEMAAALDSMKTLPPEEAAREAKVIRAFDAAAASLYAGEYPKATEALESLKPADVPAAWKEGVNKAIGSVKQIAQIAKGGNSGIPPAMEADPAMSLFAEAENAAKQEKWADAIGKYKEFAEKNPDHPLADLALSKAAGLYDEKLKDKKSAAELRQRLVAAQEKRAAANPMEQYKLGATYAEAGEPEKAVAAYRKFLAAEGLIVPGNTRLMAQYRIGGLLEKLGKTAEAVEAYKTAAAMPGDDDYAKKLKDQAQKKAAALAGVTTK